MTEMDMEDDTIDCEFEKTPASAKGTAQQRLKQNQQQQSSDNGSVPLSVMGEEHATDQLERCGRWLASIPRDDITVLRHTVEFQEFLKAFEHLGHAHLRVIVNNQAAISTEMKVKLPKHPSQELNATNSSTRQGAAVILPDEKNQTIDETSSKYFIYNNSSSDNENSSVRRNVSNKSYLPNNSSLEAGRTETKMEPRQQEPEADSSRRNKSKRNSRTTATTIGTNFSVLRFTDDIVLRILEFLRCKCLIQTSLTCSRFHRLVTKSATQRTLDIATARQLGSVMQLLRAKEQIIHVDSEMDVGDPSTGVMVDVIRDEIETSVGGRSEIECNVPVPTLLPGRRVIVTNAGDPEYNGIYYCTDCNGNGFVFTKPRFSSRPQQTITQHHRGPLRHQLEDMVFDEETNPLRQNRIVGAIQRAGRLPLVNHVDNDDDMGINDSDSDDVDDDDDDRFQPRQRRRATIALAEEAFQSGLPLRCIIAKAYSNHDILWYMSKEVETTIKVSSSRNSEAAPTMVQKRRKRTYSFYAPLMLSGNAPPELCVYPSQTSALLHQSQAWRSLRGRTERMEAPALEVLDF